MLAESGSPGGDEREQRLARVVDGYDSVIRWLAAPVHDRMRLSNIVTGVRWQRGHVELESAHADGIRQATIEARGVVSNQLIGGRSAPADLARPVRGTLFVAGEAADATGSAAVREPCHAAIASGRRAAAQVKRTESVTGSDPAS